MSEYARISVLHDRDIPVSFLDNIFSSYEGSNLLNSYPIPESKSMRSFYQFASPDIRDQVMEDLNGKPPHNLDISVTLYRGNKLNDRKNSSYHPGNGRGRHNFNNYAAGSNFHHSGRKSSMSRETYSNNPDVIPSFELNVETGQTKCLYRKSANDEPEVVDLTEVVNKEPAVNHQSYGGNRNGPPRPFTRNDNSQSSHDRHKNQGSYHSRNQDYGRPFQNEQRPPFDNGDYGSKGRGAQFMRNEQREFRKPGFSHSEDGAGAPRGRGFHSFNNDTHRNNRPQRMESEFSYSEDSLGGPRGRGSQFSRNDRPQRMEAGSSYAESGQGGPKGRGSQPFRNDSGRNERHQKTEYGNEKPQKMGYNERPQKMGYNNERPQRMGHDNERPQRMGHDNERPQKMGHDNERPQRMGHENGRPQRMGHDNERPQKMGHDNERSKRMENESSVIEDNQYKHNKGKFSPTKNDRKPRKGTTSGDSNESERFKEQGSFTRDHDKRGTSNVEKPQQQGSFTRDNNRQDTRDHGKSRQQGSSTNNHDRPKQESGFPLNNDGAGKQRGFKNDFRKENRENENVSNDSGRPKGRDFKKGNERRFENETVSNNDSGKSNARNFQNDRRRSDNQIHHDDSGKQKGRNFQNDGSRRTDNEFASNNNDESRRPKGRGPNQRKDFGGKRSESRVDNKENDWGGSEENIMEQNRGDSNLIRGTESVPSSNKFHHNQSRPKQDGRRESLKETPVKTPPSTPAEVKQAQHVRSPAGQNSSTPSTPSGAPLSGLRIPTGQYSKVVVSTTISPGFFFVHAATDAASIQEMQRKIQEIAPTLPLLGETSVGAKCLAKFHLDGEWYRARVKGVNSGNITVSFVDYGNEEVYQTEEFKVLPDELKKERPLAFKIKLSDKTPQELLSKKENDIFDVIPVEKKEGQDFWIVEIKDEGSSVAKKTEVSDDCVSFKVSKQIQQLDSLGSTSTAEQKSAAANAESCPVPEKVYSEASTCKKKTEFISSTRLPRSAKCPVPKETVSERLAASAQKPCPLDQNSYTEVMLLCKEKSHVFYVQLSEKEKDMQDFFYEVAIASRSAPALSSPTVGALCFGLHKGDWYRVKILTVTPTIKAQLIDFGDIFECTPEDLKEISTEYKGKPVFIFKIKLAENTSECHLNKELLGKLKVKPLSYSTAEDCWTVVVEGDAVPSTSVNEVAQTSNQDVSSRPVEPPISRDNYTSAEASQPTTREPVEASAPHDVCPIDQNEYSDLTLTCRLASDLYFGQPSIKNQELVQFHASVQNEGRTAPKLLVPLVGCFCFVKYEEEWYRAKILSLEESPAIRAQLVDYGDEINTTLQDLKEISAACKDAPVYCFKFKLAATTSPEHLNKEPLQHLIVRPVQFSREVNGWIVAVEGDPFEVPRVSEAASVPQNSAAPSSPLDTSTHSTNKSRSSSQRGSSQNHNQNNRNPACPIDLNKFSCITVQCFEGGGVYHGQPSSRDTEVDELFNDVFRASSAAPSLERPTCDALCLAKYDGFWYRAKILSLESTPTLQLVDYGNVFSCPVSDLKEIPTELRNRPQYLFKFKLSSETPKECLPQKVGAQLMLKPLEFSKEMDSWIMAVESKHNAKAMKPAARLPRT